MITKELDVRLLSPGFCGGADQDQPEIRAASIRGHLRRWHARLHPHMDVESVWGGLKGGTSKIQLRVEILDNGAARDEIVLPHKAERGGRRMALDGTVFTVSLASRDALQLEPAYKTLRLWSLLGALGTRANRAAGSIWPDENAPANLAEFKTQLNALGYAKGEIHISQQVDRVDALRTMASDTLKIDYLFGHAGNGREPRKESPFKVKVIEFSDGMHLLLFAEHRGIIDSALKELKGKGKPLAAMSWDRVNEAGGNH